MARVMNLLQRSGLGLIIYNLLADYINMPQPYLTTRGAFMLDEVEVAQLKSAKAKIKARNKVLANIEVTRIGYLKELKELTAIVERLEKKKGL